MKRPSVFFVGTTSEMQHHAAPLLEHANWIHGEMSVVDANEVVAKARPGDLAIFFSEHFDRFRQACVELKQNRVATLYMIDGILEWRNAWENREDEPACLWTMRPVLSDKVAVIGNSQARTLNTWGNGPKIEIVGVPRFDSLAGCQRMSQRDDGKFRVLVATAKTPGFDELQIQNTTRALKDLKTWFAQHPIVDDREVDVIWRLTGGLDTVIGVENSTRDLTGQELAEILPNVDAVVTSPSTLILEAMLSGVPVATLDYNHCPHYVPAAWAISAANQLGAVLEELASPCERKMFFQRSILSDSLFHRSDEVGCESGNELRNEFADEPGATQRFADLINLMLAEAKIQIGRQVETLSFTMSLLDSADGPNPKFEHSVLYPQHNDFKNVDVLQLQSQLAHARREIEHLNSRNAALADELAQAHAIFDEIETHPIAGPVVRIRKKLLGLIDAFKSRSEPNTTATTLPNPESVHPTPK